MTVSRLSLAFIAVAAIAVPGAALAQGVTSEIVYVTGAINDPANTSATEDAADAATPALPVVYEDAGS